MTRMTEEKKSRIFSGEGFEPIRDIFLYDDIKPFKRLNYSLLHNDRGLFEKFDLKRAVGVNGRIQGSSSRS